MAVHFRIIHFLAFTVLTIAVSGVAAAQGKARPKFCDLGQVHQSRELSRGGERTCVAKREALETHAFDIELEGHTYTAAASSTTINTFSDVAVVTRSGPLLRHASSVKAAGTFSVSTATENGRQTTVATFIDANGNEFSVKRGRLSKLLAEKLPPCGGGDHTFDNAAPPDTVDNNTLNEPQTLLGNNSVMIDLMMLYTARMRDANGGNAGAIAAISNAVAVANQAYINSQVMQQLRLVHVEMVSRVESPDLSTDLSWLRTNQAVANLQNVMGADLVQLVVHNPVPQLCGKGYFFTGSVLNNKSIIEDICFANLSLPHELGHNGSADHDSANAGSGGMYPYGYGWKWTGDSGSQWRSVMAYAPGSRIPYFSNPNVYHDGQPTGIADYADNARVLNNTAPAVAAFHSGVPICTARVPTVSVLPVEGFLPAGTTKAFEVSIKNEDTACGSTSFTLSITGLGGGWSGAFTQPVMTVPAGTTLTTQLQITSLSGAADGERADFAISASDLDGLWPVHGGDGVTSGTSLVDSTAPTAPGKLTATVARNQVTLSWIAATDLLSGVARYQVWRNGTFLGETARSSFTDLPGPGKFVYSVNAVDHAGNIGEQRFTPTVAIWGVRVVTEPIDSRIAEASTI